MEKFLFKVKFVSVLVGLILFSAFFLFVFTVKIPVWYSGIKVNLYWEGKWAEPIWLHTGRNIYNPFTQDIYKYPVFIQQKVYENVKFQDKDWLTIVAAIGMDYKFDQNKIWKIYSDYKADVSKITNDYMDNWLKNAVNRVSSTYEVDLLYWQDKEKFRKEILKALQEDLGEKWIIVNNVYFNSEMILPQQVKARIDAKIEATQNAMQKENELRAVKAEAQKKIEEAKWIAESERIKAQWIADANKLKEKSLTAEILEFEKIQKWNGELPQVVWNATPFITLPNTNKEPRQYLNNNQ